MARRSPKNADPSIPGEPSYRLHKASGQALVTLSGHDYYLSKYGTAASRDRYLATVDAWVKRGRRPEVEAHVPGPAFLLVNQLVDAYLRFAADYYRTPDGETNERELWHLRRALRPLQDLFGRTPVAEFGPKRLVTVRDEFVKAGLCRSVANRYTRRVKACFAKGVEEEWFETTTKTAGLAAVKGLRKGHTAARETEKIRPVPDTLVDALKPRLSSQVWALVEFCRYTGCRPGEAVIARPVDIDTADDVWFYRPTHHKTAHIDHDREIALPPRVQKIVRTFAKPDVTAYLFRPQDADAERRAAASAARITPLTQGNRPGTHRRPKPAKLPGERYTTGSFARAVQAACDAAFPLPEDLARTLAETGAEWRGRLGTEGIREVRAWRDEHPGEPLPAHLARRRTESKTAWRTRLGDRWPEVRAWRREHRWHPNQLRHSFATKVRRTDGIDVAATMLGHSSPEITKVYAEADRSKAREVALRIG